ncbi:MGMT family protein [Candidatus Micrarchaeota archaeon]|nr:MGMT family protein [Candidatus Micrarchaeota archaeon]
MQNFKARVYLAARRIHKGKVSTYREIAKKAGSPLAARAVGTIMHHNDFDHSGVPCHRVVKNNGEVGGYARGTRKKIQLLKSEGIIVRKGKIDLEKFGKRF